LKGEKVHDLKFAVIGAGHGGKAIAAHLAIKGFSVNLYNRTLMRIKPIIKLKGIELEGEVNGFGKLNKVSNRMQDVIKDVDIVMVVVPANAHASMNRRLGADPARPIG
jgi:opine dehydrogenase